MMKEQHGNHYNLHRHLTSSGLTGTLPKGLVIATDDPCQYDVCIWSSLNDGRKHGNAA